MKATQFWSPEFSYEKRGDGTIIMQQTDTLQEYLPTVAAYLDKWADETPQQTLLARRKHGAEWEYISYAEARSQARIIGAALLELGLGADRPLIILSEKSLEHGLLGLACSYVGIPYAPVSPAYSLVSKDHAKLKDIVALLQPGAIFADDGAAFDSAFKSVSNANHHIINVRNILDRAISFSELQADENVDVSASRAGIGPDSVVKYLFTSGSTGSPKAVINTNRMICSMEAMVRDCYRFLNVSPPVVLDWAPWNHTAAGNKVFYLALTNGGSYYIDDGKPVAGKFDETLRNLKEIACTWYFNVPAGWDMLVEALENDELLAIRFFSRLDMMFYAGANMAQHTWDRLRNIARVTTGGEVLLATGMGSTETAPFALACTTVQDKAGNVGVPCRDLLMKLVPEAGKMELRLKGPSITPGYYGDSQRTAEAFDDEGYFIMGDALRAADSDDFSKGFFFDGRTAENFKLNTGSWVAVGAVRNALVDAMGGLIRDAVIVGENEAELGALLLLSASARQLDQKSCHAALYDALRSASVSATGSASRIQRALILDRDPSFDKGEVTEKGSLNQRSMRANHAEQIAALYSNDELADGVIIRVKS